MRISDWSSYVFSSDLLAMLSAAMRFHWVVFRNIRDLLRQDGCNNRATWRRLLSWLYNYPGPMRLLARGFLSYFRPGFHPWQHADRALARRALALLTPPPIQSGRASRRERVGQYV